MRKATVSEIREILSHHALEIEQIIGVSPIQLNLPVDGRGARVKVSLKCGFAANVPESIVFTLHNDNLAIPLEVSEDFQEYEPLAV